MLLYQRYRYSQWDGTQQIFDADASDIMDAISGDLLQHGDLARALRDLFRNGMPNRDGEQSPNLRQLMERLKQQRRQQLQQSNLDSVVDDLKERMESILRAERQGIRQRLDEADAQPEPPDAAGKEQQRSLKQLSAPARPAQPGPAGRPARQPGRANPGADGLRLYGPGRPAAVPGAA